MKVPRHNCRFSARRARAGRFSAGCNSKAHRYIAPCFSFCGGVAEWLKALAWKACIRETVSWVRIPLPPPSLFQDAFSDHCRRRVKSLYFGFLGFESVDSDRKSTSKNVLSQPVFL